MNAFRKTTSELSTFLMSCPKPSITSSFSSFPCNFELAAAVTIAPRLNVGLSPSASRSLALNTCSVSPISHRGRRHVHHGWCASQHLTLLSFLSWYRGVCALGSRLTMQPAKSPSIMAVRSGRRRPSSAVSSLGRAAECGGTQTARRLCNSTSLQAPSQRGRSNANNGKEQSRFGLD